MIIPYEKVAVDSFKYDDTPFSTGKYKANTIRKKKTREQNYRIDTKN